MIWQGEFNQRGEMSGDLKDRIILATGAKGMLGNYFDSRKVIKTDIDDLDIRNRDALEETFDRLKPMWSSISELKPMSTCARITKTMHSGRIPSEPRM